MVRAASTDVLVVGGGPAGLAAALALRERGASVTVADTVKPPIDKACGEGLMPDSRRELELLGLELRSQDGCEFRGIRFANHVAEGVGLTDAATAHFPSGLGIGLRRQALHSRLIEHAEDAGIHLLWGNAVQLQEDGSVLVGGEAVACGLLVGADGQGSRVRRWARLEHGTILSRRYGFRQHFAVAPWSPYVEVHWTSIGNRGAQAYVTPVGPNEICVATLASDPQHRLQTVLDHMPWLRTKLRGRAPDPVPLDIERGAVTTTRRLDHVTREDVGQYRVALVGDASGSVDAITGEGMAVAFRQALLLAECTAAGDLARYDRLHSATLKLPQTMARIMLLMDRSVTFRNRAIGMLADREELFTRMLSVHVGEESLPRFVISNGLELAWRLAMPARATQARLA
jgi:menaquinone-9 beta-reductase